MATNGTSEEINVTFTHPRNAKKLRVAIGPGITGKAALEQLQQCKDFLPAGESVKSYALVCERTKGTLPLGSSLIEAGVQNGDVVAVTEIKEGHTPRRAS
jgi:hypothetical protein